MYINQRRGGQSGFTLIETIIYIALFGLLIVGGIGGVYNILEGSGRTREAMDREQEAYFIIRKIDTALTQAGSINLPQSNVLVTDEVRIDLDGEQIFLERSPASPVPLNDTFVPVTNLEFEKDNASGILTATFTLDGHLYSTNHQIR